MVWLTIVVYRKESWMDLSRCNRMMFNVKHYSNVEYKQEVIKACVYYGIVGKQ